MTKTEFLQRYVLARVPSLRQEPDIEGLVVDAERAWDLIKEIGDD